MQKIYRRFTERAYLAPFKSNSIPVSINNDIYTYKHWFISESMKKNSSIKKEAEEKKKKENDDF